MRLNIALKPLRLSASCAGIEKPIRPNAARKPAKGSRTALCCYAIMTTIKSSKDRKRLGWCMNNQSTESVAEQQIYISMSNNSLVESRATTQAAE